MAAATIALLIGALAAPPSQAAWGWPLSASARAKRSGKTVNGAVQRPVRLLGSQPRTVKPLGGARAPAKTILSRRPP